MILVLLALVGTVLLWEPQTGVFRQTVQFNTVGTAGFAAWAVVSIGGLVVSVRAWSADRSAISRALSWAAALLTCLVVTTWVVVIATGAIGTGTPSPGGRIELHKSDP